MNGPIVSRVWGLVLLVPVVASAWPPARLPPARSVAYGPDPRQCMDVYPPPSPDLAPAVKAPMLVLVHGGGWRTGDKDSRAVVAAKQAHWGQQQGWLVVSVNYRLLPAATVAQQAGDLATALVQIQQQAPRWGGDPQRLVLMGHSAGAHLVTLLATAPQWLHPQPAPWRATVALDSAAYDVPSLMQGRHLPLYDQAFGTQPIHWPSLSPQQQLHQPLRPFLAVCSTQRPDQPCAQAAAFVQAARQFSSTATLLPVALSHRAINAELGQPGPYTAAVDQFLQTIP